ncbi:CUBN protein, partial [Polypterus senegalus]
MARVARLFALLFLFCGLSCDSDEAVRSRRKRDASSALPRLTTDNGNLVFHTGNSKNIEFRAGPSGRVKIGDEDLTELLKQIKKNEDDITSIKNSGGGVPANVSNQINQLNSRLTSLESKVQNLEQGLTCSEDVNECQVYAGTPMACQNGGNCRNTDGSYSCECTPEWYGPHCTSRYDDCQGSSQALCDHGLCIDSDRLQPGQPSYKCICDSGWTSPAGSPACTADIDECNLPNPPCSATPPVQCFNTIGSFFCGSCPAGWQGNGYSCQDINECETNNGGCSVSPMVQCLNTMGSFHCGPCPPGYEGNGKVCTQTSICSVNNGGCHPLASCAPNPESNLPTCVCPPGYAGNGYGPHGCTAVSDICQHHNPCVNGQCISTASGYLCTCDSGWAGINCTENINECLSNPCQNGGQCIDGINGYFCNCTSSWTGPQCQTPQQVCGGYLTGQSGTFSYPNTPGGEQYDHQVSCAWVIRTDSDKIVHITFPYFSLESSVNCNFDFLQIHDGESASSHMIGKYCGNTRPPDIASSHNSLYFWFRSDHSVSAGGFTVAWDSRAPECGGELTATYGSVYSPGYPGNYPPNRDCYWTVSVSPGLLITFAFGTLSLEHHANCSFDYLEIRDGLLPEDDILGLYCSTGSPAPLRTTGPYAWIHFHSDFSVTDRGFHITYTTSPSDPGCGGTFTDSEGILISPNWPNAYANNRQCIYIIRLPANEVVSLNFTHLDLESHTSCSFDYVEVRDGSSETDPLIGKYCGTSAPAPITSSSNKLWIKFKSDASVTRGGFRAIYKVACGGILSGSGQIRSPYHPNPYPHSKTCEWVITQSSGQVVTFSFESFDIEGGSTCSFDYVELRDGASVSSPLIGKYCGTQMPPAAQSTQRSMHVRFVTDSSVSNHGFTAQYAAIMEPCGDVLTADQGTITSPGHPTSYPHGANCTWLISVTPGNIIRLTFTSFNIEFHYNCNYDYVEVYDNGTVSTGNKLGRYCGRSAPPSLTSTDHMMTILFVSDSSLAVEGFSANYISINATTACEETFTEPTGQLTSPNYPNNYPVYRECIYRIIVSVNRQIMLNFTDFALEPTYPSCLYDYVEIRDGGYETSPLTGRYCGTTIPPIIISHSNRLWIKFRSDFTSTYRGFMAHWDGTLTGCGGTLTTSSGGFTSPNYPLPYHPNSECYWLLQANGGSQVELRFEVFHLESSTNCNYDFLEVYNGNSSNSPILAKLCGNLIPLPIRSSRENLYVKLRTDASIGAGGFVAVYSQVCQGVVIRGRNRGVLESPNYPGLYPHSKHCNWTIEATAGNTVNYTFTAFSMEPYCNYDYVKLERSIDFVTFSSREVSEFAYGCGGQLTGPQGSFNSPGFPNKYPDNRECIWHIETAAQSSVQLTIHEFDIEPHPDCSYDVLEVFGGPDTSAPRLAQLCHPRPPDQPLQVSSTGNFMTIRFKTDEYVQGKGFNASWHEVSGGCGGVFTAPAGELHSPSFPNPYPPNVDCSWVLNVDRGHRVLLTFNEFEIESHNACGYDYLAVYDGPDANAPLLGKLCGLSKPAAITATQSTMYIRFRSDSSFNHKGFSAQFSEACGSTIVTDDTGGAIASPLYPSNYPHNQNCSWILIAQEPFTHVTLSFSDFSLENSNGNCTTDFVEILDGDNYGAPVKSRHCGKVVPHPETSFSNALVVNFFSNGMGSARGFRATYAASLSACGGVLYMETGAFNSPNYPDAYPPNTECVWNIISSPGNRVQLSFTMFHLQDSADCSHDYLEVREGNATGLLVARFCGSSLPANYTSMTGHILWVKFVSDASVSGEGFRATFAHLFGNEISGSSGQIASPLWPRPYPMNANYRWTITVAAGSFIQAQIVQMDIEDYYDCYADKLKFFDGPDVHSYPLGTFCGISPPPPIQSSDNVMTLQFMSDDIISGKGFFIEWTAIEESGPVPTVPPGACEGVFIVGDSPGFLLSPGWPANYQNNLHCMWLIRAPGSTVEFNVLAVDIEAHSTCYYDSLIIRDGKNMLSPILATVCGRELPGPIRSSGDSMYIEFISDSSVTRGGFNASYHRSCGGLFHANRGVISSPNYPQSYTPNLNCTYHVMVTSGFTVTVHFDAPFQVIGSGSTCTSGDYIELRNGPDASSPPLGTNTGNGRYCGSAPPATMHTSDNQLFIRFLSDSSAEGNGFKLTYEALSYACGGRIYLADSDPPGYITSPNYPDNYPQNIDCVWVVTVPSGEAVRLDFEGDFFIEPSSSCLFDYLELRDGATSDAALIARLCGQERPSTHKSTGTTMYLRFRTDNSFTHKGFKVKYSIATCGGRFFGQSGVLHSPGFPDANYPDNSECEWYLQGPTGHYLTISFTSFHLQDSAACTSDYVEIREYNASGRLLAKPCGASIPSPVDTADSFAYVKFVSDASQTEAGFSLRFDASVEVTRLELRPVVCSFHRVAPPSCGLGIYSLEELEGAESNDLIERLLGTVEGTGQDMDSASSPSRAVVVYNGLLGNSPQLAKFCGVVNPGTQVKSSANTMMVIFVTDGSVSSGGFTADYSSEEDAVCGGLLDNPNGGNFTSPGYDGVSNYTDLQSCEWTIENPSPINSSIYIKFDDFHLEHHQTCIYDYIEFRLDNSDGEFLARFCGERAPDIPLVTYASRIWVLFHSDELVNDIGFLAKYTFTDCGGLQTGESGVVASPGYPEQYSNVHRCAWLLEAPEGHTIKVLIKTNIQAFNDLLGKAVSRCGGTLHTDSGTFKSPGHPGQFPTNSECMWTIVAHESSHLEVNFDSNFEIPDSSGQCQSSFIKMWAGNREADEHLLSVGCGAHPPGPVVAPANVITARFQTVGTPGIGFSASFSTRCGANFTNPIGRMVSPSYPQNYPAGMDCLYLIDAGEQKTVILQFETFQIEQHSTCNYDGLKIYRGTAVTGFPMVTLCGTQIPGPVTTHGPMLLNFYSDSMVSDKGFLAKYQVIPCGGTFNQSSGTISSPTHSVSNYHSDMNCTYHLVVANSWVIELKFNSFDLEVSSNCAFDYVAVYDGVDTFAPLLGKFCGRVTPPVIKSSSNNLFLVFKTDTSITAGGWRATFRKTIGPQQGCGGFLNASTGSFSSPDINSDGKYEINLDCLWSIMVQPNKLVNLSFTQFDLEGTSGGNCQYDYLKLSSALSFQIYDGDSEQFPLVGTFCGSEVPATFVSSSNFLTARFISDGSIVKSGFIATYAAIDGLKIIPENSGDYGQVHRFCGVDTRIPDFYSYGRTLQVMFQSDEYQPGNGFSLTFQIAGCSREYNQSFGLLKSPGWPDVYPHNIECTIVLRAPLNSSISLFFDAFDLESHTSCSYDYLEIRNGSDASAALLGKYCGSTLPNPVFPGSNLLYLYFKSDFSMARNGFEITWTSSPNGCGGTLYGDHGSFTSPNYPASYANGTDCEWTIVAPVGRVVRVTFAFVSIDDPGDCLSNYLKLFDGPNESSSYVGPYCGLLSLRDNDLISLPKDIGELTQLKELHIQGNRLTVLPPELDTDAQHSRYPNQVFLARLRCSSLLLCSVSTIIIGLLTNNDETCLQKRALGCNTGCQNNYLIFKGRKTKQRLRNTPVCGEDKQFDISDNLK